MQDDADVDWYKPEVGWQSHVSDYSRAYREIEEPALTQALLRRTPQALHWQLSIATLTWIVAFSGDAEEVAYCQRALQELQPTAEQPLRSGSRASGQPVTQKRPAQKGEGKGKGGKRRGK